MSEIKTSADEAVRKGINIVCELLINECIKVIRSKKKIQRRRCWMKRPAERQNIFNPLQSLTDDNVASYGEEFYQTHFHMSESQFETLLVKVTPLIRKQDTLMRNSLPSRLKLQVALNYIVEGSSFRILETKFHVARCSTSAFLPEVCKAIYQVLQEYIKIPSTEQEWIDISKEYNDLWNIPNCCGVLAAKYINGPPKSCPQFVSASKTLIFTMVDAKYNFMYLDVNKSEGNDDASVFSKSNFNQLLLHSDEYCMPNDYVFVANEIFPLRTNVMKPYCEDQPLDDSKKLFNGVLLPTGCVVDNAFGLLTARFKIFSRPINLQSNRIELIVKAAFALHNWLNQTAECGAPFVDENIVDDEMWKEGKILPTNWQEIGLGITNATNFASDFYDDVAEDVRDTFAEKLASV